MLRPLQIVLGLGLCSLGGAMLYVYFKGRDEEDEIDSFINSSKSYGGQKQKDVIIQMTIANEHIPLLVGRSGANIKIIEDKTGTAIRFRENGSNSQLCEIRGVPDGVKQAKELLLRDTQRSTIVKESIFVPQSVCGKIMGRCGESLKEISRASLAKVSVESGDRPAGATRRIVITGNQGQVNIAMKLIEEKIKEDEEFKRNLEEIELNRERRRSPHGSMSSLHSSQTSLSGMPSREKIIINGTEEPMEVYVSAIASPAKFWLQLIGPQSQQLDQMVETMTEYYNSIENQAMHKIADPYLGQIVAALFKYDGKWYRAEIVGILPNEYNPRDVVLDLYFVDYGDSEYVAPHEVFELRTDFLTLRFQAIECYLANIKPTLSSDPDNWDQQAISKFEEFTQVASWKKMISRVVTYKERPKGGNHIRREGSPVPGVELFDPKEGVEINIGHMLVSHGFAVPDYPKSNVAYRHNGGDSSSKNSSLLNVSNIRDDSSQQTNGSASKNNNNVSTHINRAEGKSEYPSISNGILNLDKFNKSASNSENNGWNRIVS